MNAACVCAAIVMVILHGGEVQMKDFTTKKNCEDAKRSILNNIPPASRDRWKIECKNK